MLLLFTCKLSLFLVFKSVCFYFLPAHFPCDIYDYTRTIKLWTLKVKNLHLLSPPHKRRKFWLVLLCASQTGWRIIRGGVVFTAIYGLKYVWYCFSLVICYIMQSVTILDLILPYYFAIVNKNPLMHPQLLWSGCAIVSTWANTSASVATAMTQRSSQAVSSCAGTSPDTMSQTLHVIFYTRFTTSHCSTWMLSTPCCIKKFEP